MAADAAFKEEPEDGDAEGSRTWHRHLLALLPWLLPAHCADAPPLPTPGAVIAVRLQGCQTGIDRVFQVF